MCIALFSLLFVFLGMGVLSLSWNFCLLFGCPVWGKHHLEPLRLHLLTGSTPKMLQLNLDVEELSPTKIIHIYFFFDLLRVGSNQTSSKRIFTEDFR